jgi:phosphatidylserine/phosphatidylglycerophosphate/cardiolipin synthase-like enzyme
MTNPDPFQRLTDADLRTLAIALREGRVPPTFNPLGLGRIVGSEVFYDPRSFDQEPANQSRLHAKCVVVDRQIAFVTSANFTEAAHERNIEAGVLVRSPRFAARLADHFGALADTGQLLRLDLPGT